MTPTTQTEPDHIAISKSKGIQIDWKDGHHSKYSLPYLRDRCPCATCTGAHGTEPQPTNYSSPPAGPFQMFQPTLKMLEGNIAGAIQFAAGQAPASIFGFASASTFALARDKRLR